MLHTVEQAARIFGVGKHKVRNWIASGELVAIDVSGDDSERHQWRIPDEAIADFGNADRIAPLSAWLIAIFQQLRRSYDRANESQTRRLLQSTRTNPRRGSLCDRPHQGTVGGVFFVCLLGPKEIVLTVDDLEPLMRLEVDSHS